MEANAYTKAEEKAEAQGPGMSNIWVSSVSAAAALAFHTVWNQRERKKRAIMG